MENWSKPSMIAWLRRHGGREISLKQRGGAFALRGICRGVDKLDACSEEFDESRISLAAENADLSLSFHDEAVSAHLLLTPPGGGKVVLSMAVTLPYDRIILAEAEPPAEEDGLESDDPGKRVRSPYELLH